MNLFQMSELRTNRRRPLDNNSSLMFHKSMNDAISATTTATNNPFNFNIMVKHGALVHTTIKNTTRITLFPTQIESI